MSTPAPIPPDTKDWTWVLERPCPECGQDVSTLDPTRLPALIRHSAEGWAPVLGRADAGVRAEPEVWSPLEYAGHVRDVHLLFAERVGRMLAEEAPAFAGWDQDGAAVRGRYHQADPVVLLDELTAAARTAATAYAAVPADGWQRIGRRDDGTVFTVASLGGYHLHDVLHHLHDVR